MLVYSRSLKQSLICQSLVRLKEGLWWEWIKKGVVKWKFHFCPLILRCRRWRRMTVGLWRGVEGLRRLVIFLCSWCRCGKYLVPFLFRNVHVFCKKIIIDYCTCKRISVKIYRSLKPTWVSQTLNSSSTSVNKMSSQTKPRFYSHSSYRKLNTNGQTEDKNTLPTINSSANLQSNSNTKSSSPLAYNNKNSSNNVQSSGRDNLPNQSRHLNNNSVISTNYVNNNSRSGNVRFLGRVKLAS